MKELLMISPMFAVFIPAAIGLVRALLGRLIVSSNHNVDVDDYLGLFIISLIIIVLYLITLKF